MVLPIFAPTSLTAALRTAFTAPASMRANAWSADCLTNWGVFD
jgi:hypothetical protein